MFQLDPTTLTDTRLQLHWAAQLLAAAADAMVQKSSDDSHSNLGWDETNGAMESRVGTRIEYSTMNLVTAAGDEFSLLGKTLDQGRIWLDEELESELVLRDYEMPAHPVADGAAFDAPLVLKNIFLRGRDLPYGRLTVNLAASFRSLTNKNDCRSKIAVANAILLQ